MTIRRLPRTRNWVLIEETARRNPDVKKTTPVALSHERFFPVTGAVVLRCLGWYLGQEVLPMTRS